MFGRLKSGSRLLRLTVHIQSRSNECLVDGPFKHSCRSYNYSAYSKNYLEQMRLHGQQVSLARAKGEAITLNDQNRRYTLESLFPRKTCTLDDLVRFNSHITASASEDASSMEAHNDYVMLIIDIARVLAHKTWEFHRVGTICGKLKPQNVLVSYEPLINAHFVDGDNISGRYTDDWDPLCWKGQEEPCYNRQTKESDMFDFGCILYFCFTGGDHPNPFDDNIHEYNIDLSRVKHIPEAFHFLSFALNPNPGLRPGLLATLNHPLFLVEWWKPYFLRSVFQFILNEEDEKDEKLITILKREIPILSDKAWIEKTYACFDDILERDCYIDNRVQNIFGPSPRLGFLAELVMDIFKVVMENYEDVNQLRDLKIMISDVYYPDAYRDSYY